MDDIEIIKKNNNLIWKKVKVWFYFSNWINFKWEIIGFSPSTWFWKSYSSVDILKENWEIETDISLSLIKIIK